jgi:hypothetical protein
VRLGYLNFRQMVGRDLAYWPMFDVDELASRQTGGALTGSTNTPRPFDAMSDREHLIAVGFPTDPGSPLIYYDTNYPEPLDAIPDYYEDHQNSTAPQQAPPYRYAAMTGGSSSSPS